MDINKAIKPGWEVKLSNGKSLIPSLMKTIAHNTYVIIVANCAYYEYAGRKQLKNGA